MAKQKTAPQDETAKLMMEIFDDAWEDCSKDITRIMGMHAMYENQIDPTRWPTQSEIPLPILFTSVEAALPTAMEMLFPRERYIDLRPSGENGSPDQALKVSFALQDVVATQLKPEINGYRTVKDCFKGGIGFAIVEIVKKRSFARTTMRLSRQGITEKQAILMTPGDSASQIAMRYVHPSRIVVTKDGSDFNGPDACTWSFFIETIREDRLREWYKEDREAGAMRGSVEDIITEARAMGLNSSSSAADVVQKMTERRMRGNASKQDSHPAIVPVIRCYNPTAGIQHIIANGTKTIFSSEGRYQDFHCPLIRCTAWPDGDRFYPMSPPEATAPVAHGLNVWSNLILDIALDAARPTMLYDKSKFGPGGPRRTGAGIEVSGPIEQAAGFLKQAPFPQGIVSVAQMLEQWYGRASGEPDQTTNPQPGMVRGGIYALESILQSMTGRKRLATAILKTGFVEPAVRQVLIYMQLMAGQDGQIYTIDPNAYSEIGDESRPMMHVVPEDLIQSYDVVMDLNGRLSRSITDASTRLAEYKELKENPFIAQIPLLVDFIGDTGRARRLLEPPDRRQQIEENLQRQAADRAAQEGRMTEAKISSLRPPRPVGRPPAGGMGPPPFVPGGVVNAAEEPGPPEAELAAEELGGAMPIAMPGGEDVGGMAEAVAGGRGL